MERMPIQPLNIPKGDEIGDIADSFEKMTDDISTYVNNIETLTRDKQPEYLELLDTVKKFSPDSTSEKELSPAGKLVNALNDAIIEFSEGTEPYDDTAILVLLYRKTNIRMLPVDVSSFEEIKKAVIEIEGNTPKARQILLACDEVLSNIARYSGATTLSCTIDKSETNIKMMLIDDAVPFDQSKVKVENRDFDELDSGGMGLRLIRQSVESMAYERSNGKNILTLIFSI